jgi:hypothetical protein
VDGRRRVEAEDMKGNVPCNALRLAFRGRLIGPVWDRGELRCASLGCELHRCLVAPDMGQAGEGGPRAIWS